MLTGCTSLSNVFNLGDWDIPNDYEFKQTIEMLDSPCRCSTYMKNRFTYEYHPDEAMSPYELWQEKAGDCNDFSTFFVFMMDYHDYVTYQIKIEKVDNDIFHWLGVIVSKKSGNYLFCNNQYFQPFYGRKTFEEIVDTYCLIYKHEWLNYEVYNYDMNIIERGNK